MQLSSDGVPFIFHDDDFDRLTKAIGVRVIEIANALVGADARFLEDSLRGSAADSEDVGESDFEFLLAWKIHAGDTCH